MEVSEIKTRRLDVALELLREGKSFTFDGVSFWVAPEGSLQVSVESSWDILNITEQSALSDLERGKNICVFLIHESPAFASVVKNRPQHFSLVYDCGKSGVEVARLVDGKLVWAKGVSL